MANFYSSLRPWLRHKFLGRDFCDFKFWNKVFIHIIFKLLIFLPISSMGEVTMSLSLSLFVTMCLLHTTIYLAFRETQYMLIKWISLTNVIYHKRKIHMYYDRNYTPGLSNFFCFRAQTESNISRAHWSKMNEAAHAWRWPSQGLLWVFNIAQLLWKLKISVSQHICDTTFLHG